MAKTTKKKAPAKRKVVKKKPTPAAARGNGATRYAFPVIDADSHVFEPTTVWTDYLDREYRTLARSVFWYEEVDGIITAILNGKPAKPLNVSKITAKRSGAQV